MTTSIRISSKHETLRALLSATRGRFFHVTFLKKDGSVRSMVCRTGVTSHLKGGDKSFSDLDKGLVTVYDVHTRGYRSFSLDRILSFTFGGLTTRFETK